MLASDDPRGVNAEHVGKLRDILARLGGDEFAALLGRVRSRADIEEIVRRIERSFDDPFVVESYVLHGSASIGFALYPEDGTTKSTLLSAADTAMYAIKNERHKTAAYAMVSGSFSSH